MLNPVVTLFQTVLIGPVVAGAWRVVGLKIPELGTAAHGGLEDGIDLGPAGKLVLLFKMGDADVAELGLDGLDLHGVICTEKENLLPGGLVDKLQRRLFCLPELIDAEGVNGPEILGIDRVAQGVGHLSQDQGVHVRVLHEKADDGQGGPGGLAAAAAAAGLVMGEIVIQGADGDDPKAGVEVFHIIHPYQGQGLHIGSLGIGDGIRLLTAQVNPLLNGADIAGLAFFIKRIGDQRLVLHILVLKAESGKAVLHLLIGDIALGNDGEQLGHVLFVLFCFVRLPFAAPPGFPGGLGSKTGTFFQVFEGFR